MGRVPLALANMIHDKRRLAAAAAGIGFAVLLMCMQIGFLNSMLDSTSALLRNLDGDLFILSADRYCLSFVETFPRRRLTQALAAPGVRQTAPLYIEVGLSLWKNQDNGKQAMLRTLAYDPGDQVLALPEVQRQAHLLKAPQAVLIDLKSKPDFGFPHTEEAYSTELAGRRVDVVGAFQLGTDFANDGNIVMSTRSFQMYYDPANYLRRLERVDVGLVRLLPGADLQAARAALVARLPSDVQVLTRDELVAQEQSFWQSTTPIGFVFWLGTMMGFVVGVIICYQILYSDIDDHIAEYATLKAMGYSRRYFIFVVLQESLLLSLVGFVPGMLIARLMYWQLAAQTGLLLKLTLGRSSLVLLLTVLMCVCSGCLAIRRVLRLDPAELF